jgi:predicted ribosomally synthesized peptide with nif11-like leader
MPFDKKEISKEMIEKAFQCKTAEDLIVLAKSEGFDITKDEAEAYLAEISDMELNVEQLKNVAGGSCYGDCPDYECDY